MTAAAAEATEELGTGPQMGQLARQIVDAICGHPLLSPQEQKVHLQLIERALSAVSGAERRVAALRDHVEHLESLSRTDFLTGIANRRGFDEELRRILSAAHRHRDTGVLVLIDLDRFKAINDRYGHDAGDAVLRHVSEALCRNVRASDFVARLGGDEFAVILAHTGAAEGLYRARRLQSLLASTSTEYGDHCFRLDASFGGANYGTASDPADLLRRADLAMYRQKRSKGLRSIRLAS